MYVCIDENQGFVSLVLFFYSNAPQFAWACAPLIQVKEGYRFAKITPKLLLPYYGLDGFEWPPSLEALVAALDMSLFLACKVVDYLFQNKASSVGICTVPIRHEHVLKNLLDTRSASCFSHLTPLAAES